MTSSMRATMEEACGKALMQRRSPWRCQRMKPQHHHLYLLLQQLQYLHPVEETRKAQRIQKTQTTRMIMKMIRMTARQKKGHRTASTPHFTRRVTFPCCFGTC